MRLNGKQINCVDDQNQRDNFYDFFSVRVNPNTKKYESEDYGFCQLWKEGGGEIHCATDTNLVHIGRHHYTGNLYKQLCLNK